MKWEFPQLIQQVFKMEGTTMKHIPSNNCCRSFLQISCIIIFSVALLSQNATSQTNFKKYSGNPVLTAGPAGSWEADMVFSGSVLYHNSKYHMWYGGGKGSVGSIGYAYSDDGIAWTKYSGNPVLVPGDSSAFDASLGGGYVLFYSGKFHMWYNGTHSGVTKIGYAYSDDGIHWTKHPTYVFEKGMAGSWDDSEIMFGPVVKEDSMLKMFYCGRSATSSWLTGLATSTDSVHWIRQNSGNPVLTGGIAGTWDQYSQAAGAVLKRDGYYEMWYNNQKPAPYCIGYARSTDGGLNWNTYTGNPILRGDAGTWDAGYTIFPMVVQRPDGRYLMYYTGANIAGTIQSIGLAIDTAITQLTGTYTVGKAGYFSSLDSAFARLSRDGILGPVTFSLTDMLYDATTDTSGSFRLVGSISGAGPASRITIRPADNIAVTIQGNGDAVLTFQDVSYLTVDGVSLQGNTRLNVHAFHNVLRSYNDGIDFVGNSDFNVIQDLTSCSDDITRAGLAIGLFQDATGNPDSCLISGVSVTSGGAGIFISHGKGIIIRNNQIGSPNDSLIAWGIQTQNSEGIIIENNHVENLRLTDKYAMNQFGIDTYGSRNTIIRNNIVHNLCLKDANAWTAGMLASGGSTERGSNVWIYNNKVWDIKNSAALNTEVSGIVAGYQDSVKVDYNSVYLAELEDIPPANGSEAVRFSSTNLYPIVRNNILVNTRDDSPYLSVAIKMDAPTSLSDYNDLSVGSSGSANIGKMGTTLYKSLADWQSATKDIHSISTCPIFCAQVFHIDTTNSTSNALNGKGTPIAGILFDFEGALRNTATPDIGADEFDLITGITKDRSELPSTFALEQNFPNPFNPSTTIEYQIPKQSLVSLRIFDLLGREVATLINETKQAGTYKVRWDASRLSSGVYFYSIMAGVYRETKRMVLLK
jgi:predicted GH43/DUF377 family glycosyl hydrolase